MRSPAANAQLALLLEVAGTPKPGNVDRERDLSNLRFEHFLAGAVGARDGLDAAARGAPVGEAFETAVAGMAGQRGGNTQFGCLLNLVPLVVAADDGSDVAGAGREGGDRAGAVGRDAALPDREAVRAVCEATTVDDAAAFYRAFEHVDVAVGDPPADAPDLDVRRGADAVPAVRERGVTLRDVMGRSLDPERGPPDGNAREWCRGFPRAFGAAEAMLADEGPAPDRVARAFLRLLAEEPDTLVWIHHGEAVARAVRERAADVGTDLAAARDLAVEFVDRGINPGTTADVTCAATFLALEGGLPV